MPQPDEAGKLVNPAEGVYVRQEVDNMGWVVLHDEALVIDALEHPEKGPEVFDAIAETVGKPVKYVLNTHTHYDHVALNEAFQKKGAQIINAENTTIPDEGRWFEGAGRRVQMVPMGGLHTREDCIVWVPQGQVLFTGDLFGWGLIPLTRRLTDQAADLLEDTYRRLTDFGPQTVVPGHGPLCGAEQLRRWVTYFRWLRRRAYELVADGLDDDEALKQMPPPEDMTDWWRFVQWKHEDSVRKVLSAIRRGRLSG